VGTKTKSGTSKTVTTFMSSIHDRRTKLPARVIKKLSAGYGQALYFLRENDVLVVTKHIPQRGKQLFQINVDLDNRARLSEGKLRQLGASFGDKLQFEFVDEGTATVKVIERRSKTAEQQSIIRLPEEVENSQTYIEGAIRQITINAFERDPKARQACIDHYGLNCCVCGFNFKETYGDIGKGFIVVHHLTPVSSIGAEYEIDPIKDLRPVCPNCHAMIHSNRPPHTIEEVRRRMRSWLNLLGRFRKTIRE
jgi:predicted HNH restriction endonuclease